MASTQNSTNRENQVGDQMQFKVRKVVPTRIESFRRKSLEDVLDSTQKLVRKDSVVPLKMDKMEAKSSLPVLGANRKMSRKISLRSPSTLFFEKQDSLPDIKPALNRLKLSLPDKQLVGHHMICECGRKVFFPCLAAKRYDRAAVSNLPRSTESDIMPPTTDESTPVSSDRRRSSLKDIVDFMEDRMTVYDAVLKACKEIELVGEDDSVEVVLSRQNAVKCLLAAMRQFPRKIELLLQACKSLLRQAQLSEATLGYIAEYNGVSLLYSLLKKSPEYRALKLVVLDLFGYLSSNEEVRNHIAEKGNQSDFLTTMSRDESDVAVVQKCCVVIGNVVASVNTARTLMYVGGVHSIIHMIEKYSNNTDILQHGCTALGTFASHDDTCEHVAEAGATRAVMSAMKTHAHHIGIQESCCWALACFSRCDTVCKTLLQLQGFNVLIKTMKDFAIVTSIQEYGSWALSNMSALAADMSDKDVTTAVEVLVECLRNSEENVELIEQICFALNAYITANARCHETIVRTGCVRLLVDKMKIFEDNVDIQVNSCKILGNLAVNVDLRRHIEDEKASEVIITAMFKLDHNLTLQNTGCMALTNLSADVADNKFRILKNGAVAAVLNAMRAFADEEQLQGNGLKTLCNLLESDQACWSIAEEDGGKTISKAIKSFPNSADVVSFGCLALSSLPRKGTPLAILNEAVSTLTYLYKTSHSKTEIALSLFTFYENVLTAGNSIKTVFDSKALGSIHEMMEHFTDMNIQLSGCKIIAQLAMDTKLNMLNTETYDLMLTTMKSYISEPSIQVVCCGIISYIASSDKLKGLVSCGTPTVSLILKSLTRHRKNTQLNTVGLLAIENILRADIIETYDPDINSTIEQAMRVHQNSTDVQTYGNFILTIVGSEKLVISGKNMLIQDEFD